MIGRIVQEMIQNICESEVADEPVVVSKARPMKASNGVEGKTKPTISIVFDRIRLAKSLNGLRRGKQTLRL